MVSIVVPVYNMEKLLPRCMDTLVKQSSAYLGRRWFYG